MEKYVPLDPMNIGFLGHIAIMPRADRLADLIEELWFGGDAGGLTAALPSNRFLFSRYILALSMLSPPVANAV